MNVVQQGNEWVVLDPTGRLRGSWPSEGEARAWCAGITYGAQAALKAIDLASDDVQARMAGLKRIVERFAANAQQASVERRGQV